MGAYQEMLRNVNFIQENYLIQILVDSGMNLTSPGMRPVWIWPVLVCAFLLDLPRAFNFSFIPARTRRCKFIRENNMVQCLSRIWTRKSYVLNSGMNMTSPGMRLVWIWPLLVCIFLLRFCWPSNYSFLAAHTRRTLGMRIPSKIWLSF